MISQLNQLRLYVGYLQTVLDPSFHWQHKSFYSNILLFVYLGVYSSYFHIMTDHMYFFQTIFKDFIINNTPGKFGEKY